MNQKIDGKLFREMFISGANNLQNNKELIDKLNKFPEVGSRIWIEAQRLNQPLCCRLQTWESSTNKVQLEQQQWMRERR